MTQRWQTKTEEASFEGGSIRTSKIYTPTEVLLEMYRELAEREQATGDVTLDSNTIRRQLPALIDENGTFMLLLVRVCEKLRTQTDPEGEGKTRPATLPLRTLKSMFDKDTSQLNNVVVPKRSVGVTREQCQDKMGRPSLDSFGGINIEKEVIAKRDVELALRSVGLTERQTRIMTLQLEGYKRAEIAAELGCTVRELDNDFRVLSPDRLGKRVRGLRQAYRTLSPRRDKISSIAPSDVLELLSFDSEDRAP